VTRHAQDPSLRRSGSGSSGGGARGAAGIGRAGDVEALVPVTGSAVGVAGEQLPARGDGDVASRANTRHAGRDFALDAGFLVFGGDVNTEFL
jgi:hypothetical protein